MCSGAAPAARCPGTTEAVDDGSSGDGNQPLAVLEVEAAVTYRDPALGANPEPAALAEPPFDAAAGVILDALFDERMRFVQLAQIAGAAVDERDAAAARELAPVKCQTRAPSKTYWLSVSSSVVFGAPSKSSVTRTS